MSIMYEAAESPEIDTGSYKLIYNVLETATGATARALARALAPLAVIVDGEQLVRQKVHCKPNGGVDCWKSSVDYGPEDDAKSREQPEPGMWKFDFDTSGGRHTVTQGKMISRHWTNHFPGDAPQAPDLQGAINWDGQTVKGVERLVPNLKFNITAYYEPTLVTTGFMREISRKSARINTDTWLGFEPGELLYWGGKGSGDIPTVAGQRVKPIGIQHTFEGSENAQIAIPDFQHHAYPGDPPDPADPPGIITKKGWEYFWIWYKRMKDEDTSKVVPRPCFGYVHEIYPDPISFADFFGFGGGE